MRIGLRFQIFLLLVGVIVFGLAWRILNEDYRHWQNAVAARNLAAAQGELLRLVELLGLERGAHNEALLRQQIVAADNEVLFRWRRDTDAAINAALVNARAASIDSAQIAGIGRLQDRLADWRRRAVAALAAPATSGSVETLQGYVPAMIEITAGIRPILNHIDAAIGLADGAVATPMRIARLSADMRAEGSVRGTTYVNVVASGEPMSPAIANRLAELNGRIDALWGRIEVSLGTITPSAAMQQAVAQTQMAYYTELPKLHGLVIAASAAASPYPFSVGEFRTRQTPLHAAVGLLRDAAISDALATADTGIESRRRGFLTAVTATAAAAALLIAGAAFFLIRVANPLGAITATLTRIARGEPATIGFTDRQDDIGDVARAVVVFQRQIEERGRRESEREMRRFLETMIDAMPVAVSVKDRNLRYRFVNHYRRQLVGESADDLVGRSLGEVMQSEMAAKVEEIDRSILSSGQPQHLEQVWPDQQGEPRVIWSLKVPFKDAAGEIQGIVTCGVDITRLKEAEAELIAQREAADSANRSKTAFLANMSHELRTPLNAIIGFAEMLAAGYLGQLSNRQQEYVGNIHQSGEHLLHVVDDLLDLSRLETGTVELSIQSCKFDQVAVAALGMVRPQAKLSNIALSYDPTGIELPADERALTQILVNLLSNAIKFNKFGGRVSLRGEKLKNGVRITVEDTGVGMSAQEWEASKQALLRQDAYHARPAGGAGLGLSICRRLVEMHKGAVDIHSRKGLGTSVIVTLPG